MVKLQTSFGSFKGIRGDGVVQYLGIPYAKVKDHLSAPATVECYEGVVNATKYGPRAPAADASLFEQQVLIQQVMDDAPSPPMSGTECLNLNITVPSSLKTEAREALPVMVFIHGGGYIMGSNSAPYFDPCRLAALSVEMGTPVIVVSINYRLAVLGNLTSAELRAVGYPGNNALRDQKCAIQWVNGHIAAFGVAVLTQLFSKKPLFKRAISMSGTPLMLKPLSLDVAESTYQAIIAALGLNDASVEERIQRLISIAPEELVEKTAMKALLAPFLDDDVLPEAITFEKLASGLDVPGMKWCEELMIGDCRHDGNVTFFMGLGSRTQNLAADLYTSLSASLGAASAIAVLEAYGIRLSTSDDAALQATIDLATDIVYAAPALSLAQAWPGKTYAYHFNEGNPWEGQFKGMATHMLDAAFLFHNYNERMDKGVKDIARAFARAVVAFANGMVPWREFDEDHGSVKIFGGGEVDRMVGSNGWANGRRDTLFRLAEEGKVDLDGLSVAWDKFLAGN
ncbi:uncharacterized protein N0V89_009955 [Didymosphaeria variabile]|uniref:Carboxylesterase type B domain-containing protein n=1 Tax=Didymosphaeria variabile TaxID=1932322 RepID=A0A9W8XEG7_9PLEO|nr:uncharacterized protein N0V89_009955 [Didymosphaeria variabile]KAJ4348577.1 hypothetical protein N0V89_009955 [Didymosphaeria variabile]